MGKPWTAEEDAFVLENYSSMSYREMGEQLGRSTASVESRVNRLKRMGNKLHRESAWTAEEERILIAEYGKDIPLEEVARRVGKTEAAVMKKALRLRRKGINIRRDRKWTEEENRLLVEMYATASKEDLLKAIGRTYDSILAQATRLNRERDIGDKLYRPERKWTEEEDRFIFENFSQMNPRELSEVLERSPQSIHSRVQDLRRSGHRDKLQSKKTKWTKKEEDFLKAKYGKMTNIEIGKALGRPSAYVTKKAKDLGLKSKCVKLDNHKIMELKEKWNSSHTKVIAKEMGIPERKLISKANKLGLSYKSYSNSGSMTITEIVEVLGISKQSILNRIHKKQLKARKIQYGGTVIYRVEVEDLARFMKTYPQYYDLIKADLDHVRLIFAETNSGGVIKGLPEWLEEKIERDIRPGRRVYGRKDWTVEELRKANRLKENGWTHAKIGELLGRSRFSVANMFQSGKYTHLMDI